MYIQPNVVPGADGYPLAGWNTVQKFIVFVSG